MLAELETSGPSCLTNPLAFRQRAGAAPVDAVDVRAVAQQTRHELTEVGTEIDVDGVVGQGDGTLPGVRVRGRLDRLERDGAGRLVVVDIKTGKSPVSKDDAQRHAQLAMYQLAVAEGLLPHADSPAAPAWSTSARPAPAARPNVSRTR